ncbi:NF038104 family lipoprotein [Wielerella bovis]|uniref:NF038104 family lipoprotein n=1 Tax=Wielerella bovis TaxID=2917790 RepID=UPI002019B0BE|nr:NF038104 family lipoprotein [Wielerella bovis]ULJ63132.1 NF038104 family lipoprotein [Wielerella bovis]
MNKNIFRLPTVALLCIMLQGCAIGAAADLAATTVLTAGKLAVKGTGAVIGAMIPDGDDDDDKRKQSRRKSEVQAATTHQPVVQTLPQSQPVYHEMDYTVTQPQYEIQQLYYWDED